MRSHLRVLFAFSALFALIAFAGQAAGSQQRLHLSAFGAGTNPGALAVDQTSGEVYVVDSSDQVVRKFDADGNPSPFSALNGSNTINGSDAGPDADIVEDGSPSEGFALDASSQVALDPAGNIYLADAFNNVVNVFAPSGAYLDQLTGLGANPGNPTETWAEGFAVPCGLTLDPAGNLYVATAFAGTINRYATAGSPVEDADFDARIDGLPFGTCGLAADATGVYSIPSAFGSPGTLTKYLNADFGTTAPAGTSVAANATAVALDPADGSLFVDEANQISHLDSAGAPLEDPFGATELQGSRGIAVKGSSGRVYASSGDAQVHVYGAPATVPDVVTGSATDVEGETATLNGTVDPDGEAVTDCQFEYITAAAREANLDNEVPEDPYTGAASAACAPAPGSGSGAVPVSADLSGLEPGTVYHFRLSATNANTTVRGDDATFTTDSTPAVQTLFAGPLGETTATLAGRVNPRNQTGVSYQFEWGDDESYGNVAPAAPEPLGASDGDYHVVTAEIAGLEPGADYHFRLVATSASGTTEGPDHTLTTVPPPAPEASCPNALARTQQGVASLPDCRAYEKVSPDEKNTADVEPWDRRSTTVDGNRVFFRTKIAAPGAPQGSFSMFLATRTPSGWEPRIIDPPTGTFGGGSFQALSSDLSAGVAISSAALTQGAVDGTPQLYLRDNETGSFERINTEVPSPPSFSEPGFPGGGTPDFSKFAYLYNGDPQSSDPVAPVAPGNAYLWSRDGGTKLVGVLPDGSPAPFGSMLGSGADGSMERVVSRDGDRVVFHALEPNVFAPESSSGGQLYVREDDGINPPHTYHVSASERSTPDPAGPLPALYWSAEAEHGSKVLFTSCEKLTDDSTASTTEFSALPGSTEAACSTELANNTGETLAGRDLYLYDLEANGGNGGLTDLTTSDPRGAKVFGVVGTSEDLERIYLVAGGDLDPGAGAVLDAPNLYLWEGGEIRFIATLGRPSLGPPTNEPGDGAKFHSALTEKYSWVATNYWRLRNARVSVDGDHLLIASNARLTGYDNSSAACWNDHCSQVYLYDADEDRLTCTSCDSGDAAPVSNATLYFTNGGTSPLGPMPTNLSPDGSRAVFETGDALVSGDSNGKGDVYLWRDGRVSLISSGKGGSDSKLIDATPSGSDIFFRTGDRLTGADVDEVVDLYDARVDGGFPESASGPLCEGDACLVPPTAPVDPTPASATFAGPGNVKVNRRCAKPRVKRKGRCVVKGKAKAKKNRAAKRNRGGHR